MTGSRHRIVTESDLRLFAALAEARLLDREQAALITGRQKASISTQNAWLAKLTRANLVRRFFIATDERGIKALYSLSPKSAALIGVHYRPIQRPDNAVLTGEPLILHLLAVNQIYTQVKYATPASSEVEFISWKSFREPLSKSIPLMPDGYFELKDSYVFHSMFCEVDRGTESQKIWAKKVELYLRLAATGEFEAIFKRERFRVLVITESLRRLEQIRQTVAQATLKIFWFSTLQVIKREGPYAAHWLRPVGANRLSLP